ncbi:MAG: MATE family efflux transporter [Lachnospirales bacterium]
MRRKRLFSDRQLLFITIPIIVEQVLAVLLGLVDTMMVTYAGEAAISGVSLVNSINILIFGIISSIATGGSVIYAHKIGSDEKDKAGKVGNQTYLISIIIAAITTIIILLFASTLINIIYPNLDADIFQNAVIYFILTGLNIPFLTLFSVDAAIFRAKGKTTITMVVSVIMNILNIIGDYVLIIICGYGVFGAGLATLIVRVVGFLIMNYFMSREPYGIRKHKRSTYKFHKEVIKDVLNTGIPLSVDSSLFQVGKILVQNLINIFGPTAIAANAIFGSIAGIVMIPGRAISIAVITIVGQSLGAKRFKESIMYTKKFLFYCYISIFIMNIFLYIHSADVVGWFKTTPATAELAVILLKQQCVASTFIWSTSFILPNAFKAALDAKYVMYVSMFSMWVVRIGCAYLFILVFKWEVHTIWYSMYIDWLVRSIFFVYRFVSRTWLKKVMIKE